MADVMPRNAPKASGPHRMIDPIVLNRDKNVRVLRTPSGTAAILTKGERRRQNEVIRSSNPKGRAS